MMQFVGLFAKNYFFLAFFSLSVLCNLYPEDYFYHKSFVIPFEICDLAKANSTISYTHCTICSHCTQNAPRQESGCMDLKLST